MCSGFCVTLFLAVAVLLGSPTAKSAEKDGSQLGAAAPAEAKPGAKAPSEPGKKVEPEEFSPLSGAKVGDVVYVLQTRLYLGLGSEYKLWVDIDGTPFWSIPITDERYHFKALKGRVLATEGEGLVEFIDPENGSLEFCRDPNIAQKTRLTPADGGKTIHLGRIKGRHYWRVQLRRKSKVIKELPLTEIRLRVGEAAYTNRPFWLSCHYAHFGQTIIPNGTDSPPDGDWFWTDMWAPTRPEQFSDDLGQAIKLVPLPITDLKRDQVPLYYKAYIPPRKKLRFRWDTALGLRQTIESNGWPRWYIPPWPDKLPLSAAGCGYIASFHGDLPHGKCVPKNLTPPWQGYVKPEDEPADK